VLNEQERSTIRRVMALLGPLNRRSPRAPSEIDLFAARGATWIRKACIVIAWRPSPRSV